MTEITSRSRQPSTTETRLPFVSDIYFPAVFPVGQPLPEPFGEWSRGVRESLPTFDWEVEWIAGGHGGSIRSPTSAHTFGS